MACRLKIISGVTIFCILTGCGRSYADGFSVSGSSKDFNETAKTEKGEMVIVILVTFRLLVPLKIII